MRKNLAGIIQLLSEAEDMGDPVEEGDQGMKAALLYGPRDVRVEEVSKPRLEDGEVLIEPRVGGICGSDMSRYRSGPMICPPVVIGHECCGHIVRLGKGVTNFEVGQRVVIQPNCGCGNCLLCRMGRDHLCPRRISLGVTVDGCFAEYVKAPARYVWPITDDITDEQAALVEPLAVAVKTVRRMGNPAGRRVMILGAGPIGLLVVQLLKLNGATVSLADLIERNLLLGRQLGADEVVNVTKYDPRENAGSLTGGEGVDVVVEIAGVTKTFEQAIEIVNPGGKIILVGIPPGVANIPPEPIVRKEIEIIGSFIYSYEDFHRALQLVGQVEVAPLISHRVPLEDIGQAFDILDKGEGIKVVINLREEVG